MPEPTRHRIALIVVLFTAACRSEVKPEDSPSTLASTHQAYAGDWTGDGVTLHIGFDSVDYHMKSEHMEKTYGGKLDHFDGDSLVIDTPVIDVTLDVQKPPHEIAGRMSMIVEGQPVTRTAASAPWEKAEAFIRSELVDERKIATKTVSCKVSTPPFECTAEPETGGLFHMHATPASFDLTDGMMIRTRDAEESIATLLDGRPLEATCPNVLARVGTKFQCHASEKSSTTTFTIDVVVETSDGNLDLHLTEDAQGNVPSESHKSPSKLTNAPR